MMTKMYAYNPDIKVFKDYDFSKVDKAYKCDELSRKCSSSITALKIASVIFIILSIASAYFSFFGAASFFAPLGVFNVGTSAIGVLGTVSTTLLSIIPTYYFLKISLTFLTIFQNRAKDLIQLAKQRKVELVELLKV